MQSDRGECIDPLSEFGMDRNRNKSAPSSTVQKSFEIATPRHWYAYFVAPSVVFLI